MGLIYFNNFESRFTLRYLCFLSICLDAITSLLPLANIFDTFVYFNHKSAPDVKL